MIVLNLCEYFCRWVCRMIWIFFVIDCARKLTPFKHKNTGMFMMGKYVITACLKSTLLRNFSQTAGLWPCNSCHLILLHTKWMLSCVKFLYNPLIMHLFSSTSVEAEATTSWIFCSQYAFIRYETWSLMLCLVSPREREQVLKLVVEIVNMWVINLELTKWFCCMIAVHNFSTYQ